MQLHLFYKIVQLLLIGMTTCNAARILGIVPFEARSHSIVMTALLKELANRGHQLTVLTAVPLKEVPPNYTQIPTDVKREQDEHQNLFDIRDMSYFLMIPFMWHMGNVLSEQTLASPNVQKLIHSSNDKFDLIITESFFVEALLGFAHKFNVPYVSITTFSGTENMYDIVGNPFPYSYIPNIFLPYSHRMTFFQRLINTIVNSMASIGFHLYFIPAQDAIMKKHFANVPNLPSVADIACNGSLLLLNRHFSYSYPIPKVPNLIEVGGMHIKPPKKLPQDMKKFLDDSKDGVVYFSMGSNLQSAEMSVPKREALLKAFAKLKQRVLWKFEENLPGAPNNVKISNWFPQSDILGHPNLRVFMTHGGLLSSQEAVYNAVPLVGIPIFADQAINVLQAVNTGYALQLDYENITEESVYWTLNEVISNPKYKEAAKRISAVFHDQPQTAMEQAVFWVEYVLRHNGARHLRSAALDLAWYQYYLLDVAAVLLAVAAAAVAALVWLLRTLARLVLRPAANKPPKSSKKKD
ncbi:UDP-glycosyltransferase UGT5-like [Bacillus rossius redtenbacheri]|uniref:UDP-glycosyltransferase UGT5-like n=1 Tax=Bacillus rossius redtenbacheri TaxID=93214 RepID=UPI002FDEBD05